MNLETELRALAIDWPPTPQFDPVPRPVLEPPGAKRARRARLLAFAAAVVVAALAAAFAVPQSRGAILRFFHLGAATVRVVDTLPRADERPLSSGLGPVISVAVARRTVETLLLPPLEPPPPLHRTAAEVVSVVFRHDGSPVLLSELEYGGSGALLKKLAADGTSVEPAPVRTAAGLFVSGLFVSGRRHALFFAGQSPRLAGNVLLWEVGRTTYRLEGARLTRDEAIRLAQSLRKG
jgi:hypothetical protein